MTRGHLNDTAISTTLTDVTYSETGRDANRWIYSSALDRR
jgi:hypothetical protein